MKCINYLGAVLLGLTAACHAPTDQKIKQDSTVKDSGTFTEKKKPTAGPSELIVAGKQVGKISLGQDMEEVFKLLGKPDEGDAAMGSALGIWYGKDTLTGKKDPVVIFSSYRDSNMVVKSVKQISVGAQGFQTAEGIRMGTRLSALLAAYPSLKKTETYLNSKDKTDTLRVYDSIAEGIAFDVQSDTCTAITVHVKNRAANAVYLPVHPDWKRL
ncbi:hypothetical protein [Pedobacter hartonius]|nr:hypothetical protein [Pedobacter hartonius]